MHAIGKIESQGNGDNEYYERQMQVYHTNIKERLIQPLIIYFFPDYFLSDHILPELRGKTDALLTAYSAINILLHNYQSLRLGECNAFLHESSVIVPVYFDLFVTIEFSFFEVQHLATSFF